MTTFLLCNYNAEATVDDGSCVYAMGCDVCDGEGGVIDNPEVGDACDDGDAATVDDVVGDDCVCEGTAGSPLGCTDPLAVNYSASATTDDGSCLYAVEFNVDMRCQAGFTEPAVEGPSFGWCGGCAPMADLDGDGIYSTTLELPLGPFEYKYAVDAFSGQEDLVDDMQNGGTCAPVTDFANFANRLVEIAPGLILNDTYGTCGTCDPSDITGCTDPLAENYNAAATSDDGSCTFAVTFNVDLGCYNGNDPNVDVNTPGGFTTIAIEGPFAGWCGSCVELIDNGNGIWSITLSLPAGPFEYKYAHDGFAGQEQLVDDMQNGGDCAPITDFASYANRQIDIPAVLETNDIYGFCDGCVFGAANLDNLSDAHDALRNSINALVYPNPNNGDRFFVEMSNIDKTEDSLVLEIYDVFGKKVHATQIAVTGTKMIQELTFSDDLSAGLYTVQIFNNYGKTIEKLIIE